LGETDLYVLEHHAADLMETGETTKVDLGYKLAMLCKEHRDLLDQLDAYKKSYDNETLQRMYVLLKGLK
jgi:hypothetical protein